MTLLKESDRLRVPSTHVVYLVLVALTLPTLGQSNALQAPQRTERYEGGAGDNEVTEAAFRLTGLSRQERERVAIRICAREPIIMAMATAPASPFQIADKFVNGYAYPPERVLFLRSEDCLSKKDPSIVVTEIWAIPAGGSLPQHIEQLKSSQIKLVSLGKDASNRGVRDYRTAVDKLINNVRANPNNIGIVTGYFLEHPSRALRRRIREVTRRLAQSGLPRERYLVRLAYWPDEVSTYPPDSEPQYPSVFVVETASDAKRK